MEFTTLDVPGRDALRVLNQHRSRYAATGEYPFLIGAEDDLRRVTDLIELNKQDSAAIIRAALDIRPADWIAQRRRDAEDSHLDLNEALGQWPREVLDKGSIGLHRDILSGSFKPRVYIGLAKIDQPWHLPAALRYGNWNGWPGPEIHCAFYRHWQEQFGAEITGMSFDVIECIVKKAPTDRRSATALAWEQYWYCPDIVEQGCGSVSNLAATLMDSPYWYFWWD
jgi:hypothetical protein